MQAITDCEEARRSAERAGDLFRVYVIKFFEGRAHTMVGNAARGHILLEESVALSVQLGTTLFLGMVKAYLAECLLALGEYDAVSPLCHEAISLAEETGSKYAKALAHRTLAEALFALAPSDPLDAERAIVEAIRIQQEIGNQPKLARSYVSYARLLHGWGKAAKARDYLAQATDMFQHMDMAWDLAQAEELRRAMS